MAPKKPKLTEAQKWRLKSMQDYPDDGLIVSGKTALATLNALKRKGLVKVNYIHNRQLFEIEWSLTEEGRKYVISG